MSTWSRSPLLRLLSGLVMAAAPLANTPAQTARARVGVVSGDLGSFSSGILGGLGVPLAKIGPSTAADSLGRFSVIVVDNLFRLKDLNAAAFRDYVRQGGVLLVINPRVEGFTKSWSPYDIFIGPFTREARIVDRKHPLFAGFANDKIADLADSNGPFVGNCSFTEPAAEWKVLARQHDKKENAVILEASYGRGHMIVSCTRFDHHNAKPAATRLGDNLFRYALSRATT